MDTIKGKYWHYKGHEYELLDVVIHSESLEKMVLYKSLYENPIGKLWVRPFDMFFEEIEVGGKKVKRFEKIKSEG